MLKFPTGRIELAVGTPGFTEVLGAGLLFATHPHPAVQNNMYRG